MECGFIYLTKDMYYNHLKKKMIGIYILMYILKNNNPKSFEVYFVEKT